MRSGALTSVVFLLFFQVSAYAQLKINQQYSFGALDHETVIDVLTVANDAAITLSRTRSGKDGDIGSASYGNGDLWLMKLGGSGKLVWETRIGGNLNEAGICMSLGKDSTILIAGATKSNTGSFMDRPAGQTGFVASVNQRGSLGDVNYFNDRSGISDLVVAPSGAYYVLLDSVGQNDVSDLAIMKYSSSHKHIWTKVFGGPYYDVISKAIVNANEELLAFGYTTNSTLQSDADWVDYVRSVFKIDSSGSLLDYHIFNDESLTYNDEVAHILPLSSGSYILSGSTEASTKEHQVLVNGFVAKVDENGKNIFTKVFGGNFHDQFNASAVDTEENIWLFGESDTGEGDGPVENTPSNLWVMRLNSQGKLIDQRLFGGSKRQAAMVGFIRNQGMRVIGWTSSSDGDVKHNNGKSDVWILDVSDVVVSKNEGLSGLISVYPAYVRNSIFLDNQAGLKLEQVSVYAVDGSLKMRLGSQGGDLSSLLPGTYILRIVSERGVISKRFIKG